MRYRGPPFLLDMIAAAARPPRWKKSQVRVEGDVRSPRVRGPPLPAQHPPRAQPRGGGSGGETEAFPAGERSPSPPGLPRLRAVRSPPGHSAGGPGASTLGCSGPRGRDTWAVEPSRTRLTPPAAAAAGLQRADARGTRGRGGTRGAFWVCGFGSVGSEFVTPPSARRCAVLSAPAR